MPPISKRSASATASSVAAEAARRAAEQARAAAAAAAKAAAAAAKAAAASAAKAAAAAGRKDAFSAAGAVGKAGAGAKAELKATSTALVGAAKNLAALPEVAAGVKAVAAETQKLAEQSNPVIAGGGVGASTVESVTDKAKGWLLAAKAGVSTLYDAAKTKVEEGIKTLEGATKTLDGVLNDGRKELKSSTIDAPIDNLKPGDQMSVNGTANFGVGLPQGVSIKGQVQMNTSTKMEDDGSYTIRRETSALESVSVGGTTQRGADVNADTGAGGSVTQEYKVRVNVKNPDGSDKLVDGKPVLDPEATKARAKEITDLLVNPPTKPLNPLLAEMRQPEDARTPEQKKMMDESYSATEYKGSLADSAAIALGVPNKASVAGNVKAQTDFTLRIQKTEVPVRGPDGKPLPELENGKPKLNADGSPAFQLQPGTKVTTSVSSGGELGGEGSVNVGKITTLNGDGKVAAKTTLSTTFEYPGGDGASGITELGKLRGTTPHVTAALTREVDLNGGGGGGAGGDLIIAKGNVRELNRVGATQVTTITVDDPLKNGAEVLEKATQGNLSEAAKVAGDNTRVTVETNIYTERARIIEGGFKVGKVVDLSTKLESVERHTVAKLPKVDVSGTDIALASQRQAAEVKKRLEDSNLRPVNIRA